MIGYVILLDFHYRMTPRLLCQSSFYFHNDKYNQYKTHVENAHHMNFIYNATLTTYIIFYYQQQNSGNELQLV